MPEDSTRSARQAAPRPWRAVAGVWCVYFAFGAATVSLAPLVDVLSRDLEIGRARFGLILGAWQLAYLFAALPAGQVVSRASPRTSLLVCALLIAASSAAKAAATGWTGMFAAVLLLGIGGPLVSVGAPRLAAALFPGRNRNLAIGVILTGPAIGSAVTLAATPGFLMPALSDDWRRVMLVHAAVALVAGLAWLCVAPGRQRDGGTDAIPATPGLRMAGPLARLPGMMPILLLGTGAFFINHGMNNWLPSILDYDGFTAQAAGCLAAAMVLAGITGTILLPLLQTVGGSGAALAGLFATTALAMAALWGGGTWWIAAALTLYGLVRGAMLPLLQLALLDLKGLDEDRRGLAIGLFFVFGEIGGVLGPVVLGLMAGEDRGFAAIPPFLAATSLALCVMSVLFVRREAVGT